ncbi:MAG TPA: ABC transporter substrate-binding protein [Stellaceae bacterium]|nr:ABC transporter substrate-binding protein [Stellaceae bacterium]
MRAILLAATALVALGGAAQAAGPLKLGLILSKSGAAALPGEEMQRGFDLAFGDLGGKLGGVDVKLFSEDDKSDPAAAVQVASKFIDEDKVDIMTGFLGSNTTIPIVPTFLEAGVWVVGALSGPEEFAGKDCKADAFFASFENEDWDDALAQYLNKQNERLVYFMGADYQAGWEKIGGAMKFYKGKTVGPVYTPWMGQVDFAPQLSQVRAADPSSIFVFLPGGTGILFLKQFAQAGLHDKIKIYSEDTLATDLTFGAEGDSALGVVQSTSWSYELDNPANKKFVSEFVAKYGRRPAIYAALQYDAVNLIDSAVKAVHGDLSNKDAFRAALKKADFQSVRGPFAFDNNHYPVQNIYLTEVVKDPDGKMRLALRGTAVENWHDVYHDQCPMK